MDQTPSTRRCKASSEASVRVHFPARARAIWNRHLRQGRVKPVQRCLLESVCLHGLGEYGIDDKARPCKTISNQLGIDNFLVPELRGDVEAPSFDKALDFLMIFGQVSVWRCHCLFRSVCSCHCMFGAVCLDVNFWFPSSGAFFRLSYGSLWRAGEVGPAGMSGPILSVQSCYWRKTLETARLDPT